MKTLIKGFNRALEDTFSRIFPRQQGCVFKKIHEPSMNMRLNPIRKNLSKSIPQKALNFNGLFILYRGLELEAVFLNL